MDAISRDPTEPTAASAAAGPTPPPRAPRRRDWRRAWRAVVALYRDSERTEQVFEVLEALEGSAGEEFYRRYTSHPEGRRLLAEKPDLVAVLSDHEALRRLPDGSFGRAYLAFMEEAGLNAQDLIDAEGEAGVEKHPDPDRQWVDDRGRDCHDLWHVLTGYGRDEAGEAGLLAFTYATYPNLGILLILLVSAAIGPKSFTFTWERYLLQAYRRGRASTLYGAPYEDWLALPLDEVRRLGGIVPPEVAHPATGIAVANREKGQVTAFTLRA